MSKILYKVLEKMGSVAFEKDLLSSINKIIGDSKLSQQTRSRLESLKNDFEKSDSIDKKIEIFDLACQIVDNETGFTDKVMANIDKILTSESRLSQNKDQADDLKRLNDVKPQKY